ncbi:MAG: ATP-binding protein [Chthoniobacteraceae bacterium]
MSEDSTSQLIKKLAQAGSSEAALLHFLLENIPAKIYFKDRDSRFLRISHSLANFFGLSSAYEAIGKTDFDFFTREHAEAAFADEQEVMRTGAPITDKVEKETLPNGAVRWAMTTKMPLWNPRHEMIGTCGISQDATAQKELESALATTNEELLYRQQELQQALADLDQANQELKAMQQELVDAEKLQSLGRLVYGVAHEIRNPLNILLMGLEFLSSSHEVMGNSSSGTVVGEMKSAIGRADTVIGALMETVAADGIQRTSTKIQDLLDEVLVGLQCEFEEHHISLQTTYAADFPPINVDAVKIKQVVHSIVINAIDAMPKGGAICISMHTKELDQNDLVRDAGSRSIDKFLLGKKAVFLEIADTGVGINSDVMPRIFDPFFTTKETGKGTGLGLTLSRKLVELHQGFIRISNRGSGSGVSVVVVLPAIE